ncbi:MAG: DUF4070 domain-containing protein [Phycisphaerae bacterium]|nr:DUF4070 domain-containing protein [Phycisphaerae bacterium]NUQ47401.1 DUF4070 domain-containing protein [Phycisphaerae bacterium]
MNVLLVSPATPDTFWSFKHVLPFVGRKAAFPPLGLLTVAAMLPGDWRLRLVDLNVTTLTDADLDWADYVFVSAMIVHEASVRRIAARCNAKCRPIVAGGPLFTTGHLRFPEIPHFVLGEAENIMPALIADMRSGEVRHTYQDSAKPDLSRTPSPRWNLIRLKDYATMAVQYSRGCPFDCEFCDIISMYGRTPRVKPPARLIAELEGLHAAGWKGGVFIVDDNFIGHKVKAKALLRALIAWHRRGGTVFPLLTEASLNLADDAELLSLMSRAGFKKVFIGVETPDEQTLASCGKVQNTRRDLVAAVRRIQQAGLEVMGGFIVGFDGDEHSIFERQQRFIQESGIATAMVGLLTALPQTRLFARLKREGRLLGESTGNNVNAVLNFVPRMDREQLVQGYRRLVQRLYAPGNYYRRALAFLRWYRPRGPRSRPSRSELGALLRSMWTMGVCTPGRRAYWQFLLQSLLMYPRAFGAAVNLAINGHHFRKIAATL